MAKMGIVTMELRPSLAWVATLHAPLYVLTYPQRYTDDDLLENHRQIADWYATVDQPIAWVVDCSHIVFATARQRKIVADHEASIREYAERYNKGVGIVITNPMVRGMLTAVFWMSPPPFTYEIFGDVAGASHWARSKLDAAVRSACSPGN